MVPQIQIQYICTCWTDNRFDYSISRHSWQEAVQDEFLSFGGCELCCYPGGIVFVSGCFDWRCIGHLGFFFYEYDRLYSWKKKIINNNAYY
jgi:hypothetical protein